VRLDASRVRERAVVVVADADGGRRPLRRRRVRVALALVAVLALAAAAYGATYAPIFRARHLVVVGAHRVGEEEVIRASGFTERTNVVHAELEEAERRVAALPWVLRARADRELPGTLVVTVWERVPIARLGSDDGRLVSRDGRILDGTAAARLPTVAALVGEPAPDAVADAAAALAAMARPLYRSVAEVVVVPGGSLLIRLRSGLVVEWGSPDEHREKAQALSALLAWAKRSDRALESVDVSAPQAPRAVPVPLRRRPTARRIELSYRRSLHAPARLDGPVVGPLVSRPQRLVDIAITLKLRLRVERGNGPRRGKGARGEALPAGSGGPTFRSGWEPR
jgi:cell division protein FtsQ